MKQNLYILRLHYSTAVNDVYQWEIKQSDSPSDIV